MARKPKSGTLDFYYLNNEDNKKKSKKNKKTRKNKVGKKPTSKTKKNVQPQTNNTFNIDEEIIIGVTRIPASKTPAKNKNKKKTNKKTDTQKKKKNYNVKVNKKIKEAENNRFKRKKHIKLIIKIILLLSLLISAIVLLLTSSIFNISDIKIIGNNIIPEDKIISLSDVYVGQNIYNISKKQIINNVKQNAYIDSVKINRKLPNTLEIIVEERKPTFMIEYINSYVYLSNQGYMLEISSKKLELPIISGISTSEEYIYEGNRLDVEDLEKLDTAIKIVESYKNNEISGNINKIDISNKNNYKLILESGKKTVYLGDASNINNRILYLKSILQEEKGKTGEIFINGDMNSSTNKVFFRDNTP